MLVHGRLLYTKTKDGDMSAIQVKPDDNQYAWDTAVSAINAGKIVRFFGNLITVLAIIAGIASATFYVIAVKGHVGMIGALSSLIAICPSVAAGQALALYGLRGIMHGFELQQKILDLDSEE